MALIPLNCRNCAAPLQVPEDLKHVTCMHCGTQLAVVHEGGAAYTEKLDQLAERTEKIEDKVDQLHRQQQIASLDREWELAQQGFLVKGKDGHTSIPSAGGAIFSCLAGIGFCILATTIGLNASEGMSGPGPGPQVIFPAFGALAAVVGIGTGFWQFVRADQYQQAKRRYESRRRKLLSDD